MRSETRRAFNKCLPRSVRCMRLVRRTVQRVSSPSSSAKRQMFSATPFPRRRNAVRELPLLLFVCSFAAFKKCLAKPERYCQSHCRRRAHDSFRGTIRGSRTSVSASMAQAPSRDFLYSVIDPQPLAFPKTRANINPRRCIHSGASLTSAGCSNRHITLALVKPDVRSLSRC